MINHDTIYEIYDICKVRTFCDLGDTCRNIL